MLKYVNSIKALMSKASNFFLLFFFCSFTKFIGKIYNEKRLDNIVYVHSIHKRKIDFEAEDTFIAIFLRVSKKF